MFQLAALITALSLPLLKSNSVRNDKLLFCAQFPYKLVMFPNTPFKGIPINGDLM